MFLWSDELLDWSGALAVARVTAELRIGELRALPRAAAGEQQKQQLHAGLKEEGGHEGVFWCFYSFHSMKEAKTLVWSKQRLEDLKELFIHLQIRGLQHHGAAFLPLHSTSCLCESALRPPAGRAQLSCCGGCRRR